MKTVYHGTVFAATFSCVGVWILYNVITGGFLFDLVNETNSKSPCSRTRILEECISTTYKHGGSSSRCVWCPRTRSCHARQNLSACVEWCGLPYLTISMEDGAGHSNQKLAYLHAVLIAAHAHAVLVLPQFFSRTRAEFPAVEGRKVSFNFSELFDVHALKPLQSQVCMVSKLPASRKSQWLKLQPRHVFSYVPRSPAEWDQNLPAALLAVADEISLGYTYMTFRPTNSYLYRLAFTTLRPVKHYVQIASQVIDYLKRKSTGSNTAAIHLRLEDDVVLKFRNRVPPLSAILLHLDRLRLPLGNVLYVASGLTRAILSSSCESSACQLQHQYMSTLCAMYSCIFKGDVLKRDDMLFDTSAIIDTLVLEGVDIAFLTIWSTMDWFVAIHRQFDNIIGMMHAFYDTGNKTILAAPPLSPVAVDDIPGVFSWEHFVLPSTVLTW